MQQLSAAVVIKPPLFLLPFIVVVVYCSFSFIPLKTLRCINGSLVATKSRSKVLFADQSDQSSFISIHDTFQRLIKSKFGGDDPMFRCSIVLATLSLKTTKIIPRHRMPSNCSLFCMMHCSFLILLNTLTLLIQNRQLMMRLYTPQCGCPCPIFKCTFVVSFLKCFRQLFWLISHVLAWPKHNLCPPNRSFWTTASTKKKSRPTIPFILPS